MRLPCLIILLCALATDLRGQTSTAPATTQAASQPASPRLIAEFPIDHRGDPLFIPVVWEGKPSFFLVDTGSTHNVVDATAFPNLIPRDNKVRARTSGGAASFPLFNPPDLQVGPFALARCGPVLRHNFLSDIREITGRPVIGILGTSAMSSFILQIDFDSRKFRFFAPDFRAHPEWGMAIPMQIDAIGTPSINLRIENNDEIMEIDSGSNGAISLTSKQFDRLLAVRNQPVISTPALTVLGNINLRRMRSPSFELAGLHYENLILNETKANGSVGLGFLQRHLATLDFPGRQLYVKAGKDFSRPSEANMCGLRLGSIESQVVAKFVDAGSPAFEAGIREGDVLLDVNGKTAIDYPLPELGELFRSGDGQKIDITFRRGDNVQKVTVVLKRAI